MLLCQSQIADLRCDMCTYYLLGHGTTEDKQLAEEGVTKIIYVSGFQVDCFLYLVHKSFEIILSTGHQLEHTLLVIEA